jgi:WD40 repeat protein
MSAPAAFLPSRDKPDQTHGAPVLALQVSANYVVSSSADSFVRVWLKSSSDLALPPLSSGSEASIKSVEISEELGLVFGGNGRGNIVVWRLSDGERLHVESAHDDTVLSLAIDTSTLVSTSKDQCAKIWELQVMGSAKPARLQLRHTLQGHSMPVLAAQLSNHRIYTTSADKSCRIWDQHSGNLLSTLQGISSAAHFQITEDTAGRKLLVTAGTDGKVRIYDADTGTQRVCLEGHTNVVCSVQLLEPVQTNSEHLRIASASYDGTIRLWTLPQPALASWECVQTFSFSDAVLTPRAFLQPTGDYQDDPIREGKVNRSNETRQGEKHVNRAIDMQVSDGYLYCGGEGAYIVAWCLASCQNDTTV